MQGFHEVRFPTDISYDCTGGPEFSTDVVETGTGWEQRNVNHQYAKCKYNAAHGVKTEQQMATLLSFFRARKGKGYGFRYKDWSDYKGTVSAPGDGVTRVFQLMKIYFDDAGYSDVRIIKKPVEGTVKLYVGGELVTSGIEIDYTTGIITLDTAPGEGVNITCDFEFDVPVRFDTDYMPINLKDWNIYSWDNIPIVEVRI